MCLDLMKKCVGYEPSLDKLVYALCLDYDRRERAIAEGSVSHRTEMEYRYINYRMLSAAEEICGDSARIYIDEVASRTGYASSEISNAAEVTYKLRKLAMKQNIARSLHLLD